jgi:hypothetical protein
MGKIKSIAETVYQTEIFTRERKSDDDDGDENNTLGQLG